MEIQRNEKTTLLFISHDLSIVRYLSDRVMVMYLGHVVELGSTDQVFAPPYHPYTEALLSAVPVPDPVVEDSREQILLSGDLPSPANPPSGCRFHTRCPWRQETLCDTERPQLRVVQGTRRDGAGAPAQGGAEHKVACHWAEQIETGEIQPHSVTAEIDETATALAASAEAERLTGDLPFA